jgi:26S proteasome regulatory subunit N1
VLVFGFQSEEDRKLKEDLDLAVTRVCDATEEAGVKTLALEVLRREIRTSTSSMTSVPKPLKFLRPSYVPLKEAFEVMAHIKTLNSSTVPPY